MGRDAEDGATDMPGTLHARTGPSLRAERRRFKGCKSRHPPECGRSHAGVTRKSDPVGTFGDVTSGAWWGSIALDRASRQRRAHRINTYPRKGLA
ncbi:hypothetical protein HMPREF9056_01683 [Actinomyces sp. oral taxon 170 str. F0386]|nr:hypothetical protein HMPREF9056_01683 [Actinomyces sp. oral taxon 170 str. F0386]